MNLNSGFLWVSAQQWLKRIIDEKTMAAWPDSVKALAGSWQDAPRENF